MKYHTVFFFMVSGIYFVFMAGCSGVQVVPEDLEEQVNREYNRSAYQPSFGGFHPAEFEKRVFLETDYWRRSRSDQE